MLVLAYIYVLHASQHCSCWTVLGKNFEVTQRRQLWSGVVYVVVAWSLNTTWALHLFIIMTPVVVHCKPSWSPTTLLASLNTFSPRMKVGCLPFVLSASSRASRLFLLYTIIYILPLQVMSGVGSHPFVLFTQFIIKWEIQKTKKQALLSWISCRGFLMTRNFKLQSWNIWSHYYLGREMKVTDRVTASLQNNVLLHSNFLDKMSLTNNCAHS